MLSRFNVRGAVISLAAPLLAVAFAVLVGSLILAAAGDPVGETWRVIWDTGQQARSISLIINQAVVYYLSAVAVAVGFRMNLFNIGVDGQYRLAAFAAALTAAYLPFPGQVNIVLSIVAAMLVGALWAGIAGVLKVTRGVNEVISTIMLNAISTSLIAYLLLKVSTPVLGSNNRGTKVIPGGSHVPGMDLVPGSPQTVYGLAVLAVLVGITFWVMLNRTRFGFDLRASGASESAAVASGVQVKRMVVIAMLISGAFAGLVGLPELFGGAYTYSQTFPIGLGFTGIAIALLGRNSPIGIAFGALLFSFLDVAANPLQILANVSSEIVTIMQGIIVLAVVIAYEVIRRYRVAQEQRNVARQLQATSVSQEAPA
jgi:general nucleoside transport system permease protein